MNRYDFVVNLASERSRVIAKKYARAFFQCRWQGYTTEKEKDVGTEQNQNINDGIEHEEKHDKITNGEDLKSWLKYIASRLIETAKKTDRPVGMELLLEILDAEIEDRTLTTDELWSVSGIVEGMGVNFEMGNFFPDEATALESVDGVYTNDCYTGFGYDIYENVIRFGGDASFYPSRIDKNGDIVSLDKEYIQNDLDNGYWEYYWEYLGTFTEYIAHLLKEKFTKTGKPIDQKLLQEVLDDLDDNENMDVTDLKDFLYNLNDDNDEEHCDRVVTNIDDQWSADDQRSAEIIAEILKLANKNEC